VDDEAQGQSLVPGAFADPGGQVADMKKFDEDQKAEQDDVSLQAGDLP
jgi:hypothetical protein